MLQMPDTWLDRPNIGGRCTSSSREECSEAILPDEGPPHLYPLPSCAQRSSEEAHTTPVGFSAKRCLGSFRREWASLVPAGTLGSASPRQRGIFFERCTMISVMPIVNLRGLLLPGGTDSWQAFVGRRSNLVALLPACQELLSCHHTGCFACVLAVFRTVWSSPLRPPCFDGGHAVAGSLAEGTVHSSR
jgi:hypothetical protein